MQIAVIGSNGQVGSEIVREATAANIPVIALRHQDCEVTNTASVEHALHPLGKGDIVVNTAAFHRVEECEEVPDRALSVNALGAYRVAAAAQERGATSVLISTDYVFDGSKTTPYTERDVPAPINMYGASKAAAEQLVRSANPDNYIIRISAVFGPAGSSGKGGNFVESMIAKARSGTAPEVVDDLVMAPTSAGDAAMLLVQLLLKRGEHGVYHLANAGQCSWREFADTVFELIGTPLRALSVSAATRPGKARRPPYSVLASERLDKLGLQPRHWKDSLASYLSAKGYLAQS